MRKKAEVGRGGPRWPDEAQDEEELAAWQAANAAFEALAPQERFEVGARQAAVDLLVLLPPSRAGMVVKAHVSLVRFLAPEEVAAHLA